jgi:hypothetical protein
MAHVVVIQKSETDPQARAIPSGPHDAFDLLRRITPDISVYRLFVFSARQPGQSTIKTFAVARATFSARLSASPVTKPRNVHRRNFANRRVFTTPMR